MISTSCKLLCTLALSLWAAPVLSEPRFTLDFLHGDWVGSGVVFGQQAQVSLAWKPALEGRFTQLSLVQVLSNENSENYRFEGVAYYSEADPARLSGVWIDSQGHIYPISGTLSGQKLVVEWGSADTESGQSSYELLSGGTLQVADSVRGKDGEWQTFGKYTVTREP